MVIKHFSLPPVNTGSTLTKCFYPIQGRFLEQEVDPQCLILRNVADIFESFVVLKFYELAHDK